MTLAFGRFSSPPALGDVNNLAFDQDEINQLKSCRPGNCDTRLGGAGLDALRTSIDWNAPDYAERVNAFAEGRRRLRLRLPGAWRCGARDYNDRSQPVSLKDHGRESSPTRRCFTSIPPN